MREGDFWFKNGTIQNLENFVVPFEDLIESMTLVYQLENGEERTKTFEYDHEPDPGFWKPYFLDLFYGQCFKLELYPKKKIKNIILNTKYLVKVIPHTPGRITSLQPAYTAGPGIHQ